MKLHYWSLFVGEQSLVKCLGLAGDSFSPHPLPLLAHFLSTSPQSFAHPKCAPSLAHFFARLFNLCLEKERKQLLRRQNIFMNHSFVQYLRFLHHLVFMTFDNVHFTKRVKMSWQLEIKCYLLHNGIY